MTGRDREWGELNGSTGCCPRCRRSIWVESACAAECSCGWTDAPDEDEETVPEPEGGAT